MDAKIFFAGFFLTLSLVFITWIITLAFVFLLSVIINLPLNSKPKKEEVGGGST